MTGQELFYALSFVDEKYVQEAETAKLGNKILWMKWISAAACLCILITGVYAYSRTQNKGETESIRQDCAAPAETMAAEFEAAPPMEAEMITESAAEPELPLPVVSETPSGELLQIPYAKLRVVKVLEDGSFEAIAEATQDMEADTQVTVVVDPSKVPGAEGTIVDTIGVAEGMRIEIYDGAYDASQNVLYVAELIVSCF